MMQRIKGFLTLLIITLLITSSTAWAKVGHKHHKNPKVKYSDLDRANKAGEIRGSFVRCSGDSSGIFVYVVGRSFSALLTPAGDFTLSYVPPGVYSLAFVNELHILTTIDNVEVRKHKLTHLGTVEHCVDNDNDNYDESVDCNDNNPNIHPGAEEVCDGEDNDCNGAVDDAPGGCQQCDDNDNDGFFAQNGCGSTVDCDDNDPTVNPSSLEVCDGRDNNCNGQTDEDCPLNCPQGTADCNNDRIDCETDLTSDANNCGTCGSACGQGQTCVNGSCEGGSAACTDQERFLLQTCFADCGGDLNCPANCLAQVSGTCANAVQLLGLCAVNSGCPTNTASDLLSLCVSQSCPTQWEDAFGDHVPGCSAGQTQCGSQCVDLQNDENNCGSCNQACAGNEVCSNGICRVQCGLGESNCNGQCVDLSNNVQHCGGCNVACGSGESCSNGLCEAGNSCIPGTPCNADSNGCTQDVCDSTGTCVVGSPPLCSDGLACTTDSCVSTGNNTFQCNFEPIGTKAICNGQCVDTNTDENNCGGCNIACQTGNFCSNGICEPDACALTPLSRPCTTSTGCTGIQHRTCFEGQVSDWGTCDPIDPNCAAPVDCQVSDWSAWSACSATCGGGTQTRSRSITVPPSNGGADCPNLTETRACNTQACQMDADGDGFFSVASGGSDCDDFNPSIHPNASEVCGDNIDNNCDGLVDESNVCQQSCPSGQNLCNGVCVDLSTDANNCGVCGFACPSGWSCSFGDCAP